MRGYVLVQTEVRIPVTKNLLKKSYRFSRKYRMIIIINFCFRKNRGNGEAGSQHDSLSFKAEDEEESGEGLTTLIPDIRATAKIVEVGYYRIYFSLSRQ